MLRLIISVTAALWLSVVALSAQSPVMAALAEDSTIVISQPAAVADILRPTHVQATTAEEEQTARPDAADTAVRQTQPAQQQQGATVKVPGFRVQIFSDNNSRTAKGEARTKASQVGAAFPEYRVYQLYDSPYWRVKIGDFRSRNDAERLADDVRRQFPAISREVRVVRDHVNAHR